MGLNEKQMNLVEAAFKAGRDYSDMTKWLKDSVADGGVVVEDLLRKEFADIAGECVYCKNPMRCEQCEQDHADYMETIISASRG